MEKISKQRNCFEELWEKSPRIAVAVEELVLGLFEDLRFEDSARDESYEHSEPYKSLLRLFQQYPETLKILGVDLGNKENFLAWVTASSYLLIQRKEKNL